MMLWKSSIITTAILHRHHSKWSARDIFSVGVPLIVMKLWKSSIMTTTILHRHPAKWSAHDSFSVVGPLIVMMLWKLSIMTSAILYRHPAKWSARDSFSVVGPLIVMICYGSHQSWLITCVIAWSNPHRLLPIWREKLRGHYHVTMTCDNDFCVWRWYYRERHSRVSVNAIHPAQFTPYSRTYHIAQWSSCLDWLKFVYRDEYRNDKKCCFLCVFVKKYT